MAIIRDLQLGKVYQNDVENSILGDGINICEKI